MKKWDRTKEAVQNVQTGLTALMIIVLAATGLFVTGALLVASADNPVHASTDTQNSAYPSPPNSGHQSMTPNGQAIPDASTQLLLPLILKTDNSEKRLSTEDRASLRSHRIAIPPLERRPLYTSLFAVDSHLGRQFTLVGAKPSGTG